MTDYPGQPLRRRVQAAISILVIAVVIGVLLAWANTASDIAIDSVVSDAEAVPLVLLVHTCGGQHAVEVTETERSVTVRITDQRSRLRLSQTDCLDAVEVDLAHPLGDRVLIDATTGNPVPAG